MEVVWSLNRVVSLNISLNCNLYQGPLLRVTLCSMLRTRHSSVGGALGMEPAIVMAADKRAPLSFLWSISLPTITIGCRAEENFCNGEGMGWDGRGNDKGKMPRQISSILLSDTGRKILMQKV